MSKEMMPYFFYQFYTFEYTSQIMRGNNPNFDVRKQYEVELTDQFIDYMRSQTLKIDLIDDSVDIMKAGVEAKDYIGSVRIAMKDLIQGS
jgi:hypothetical protein